MKQATVMVDIDGVVADFAREFHRRSVEADRYDYTEPATWNFAVEQWGWTREHYQQRFKEWVADGIFNDLDPLETEVAAVRQIISSGIKVHFLTTRPPEALSDTYAWLCRHFGPEAWRWTAELTGTKTGGDRFVAAIDDLPDNLVSLSASGCPDVAVCARPWNAATDLPRLDVHDWAGRIIESHAG